MNKNIRKFHPEQVAKELSAEAEEYRAHHDVLGNYYPNPNRQERRALARSWKKKRGDR